MLNWTDIELAAANQVASPSTTRPFIAMSAKSLWAEYFLGKLAQSVNFVGCYDERLSSGETCSGIVGMSLNQVAEAAANDPNIAVVDFSRIPYEVAFNVYFCTQRNIECFDFSLIMRALDMPMMYESPSQSRHDMVPLLDQYQSILFKFADQLSIQTFLAFLMFRLTFDRRYLLSCLATPDSEYFNIFADGDGLQLGNNEVFADVGAYRGDTVYKFLAGCRFEFNQIHAFEPDLQNYMALRNARLLAPNKITLYRKAVSDRAGKFGFSQTGTAGSGLTASSEDLVETVRLDDVMSQLTLLKIDVEGYEAAVIRGASALIASHKPKIASACYHYAGDLLDIIRSIESTGVEFTYRLRHYSSYCGDTCLYAVPKET